MQTNFRAAEKAIRQMAEKWPASFVAREQLKEFSGGSVSPGSAANLDSQGLGPKDAFKIGRKVCYPLESLIEWLIERAN